MPWPLRTIQTRKDFDAAMEQMWQGDGRLRQGRVELPSGWAGVLLHVEDYIATNTLYVRGLVRHESGIVSGERHAHPFGGAGSGAGAHEHNNGCGGFRLVDDRLLPSRLNDELDALPAAKMEVRDTQWHYALDIVNGLVDPAPSGDIMNPENTSALRWMRAMHATGVLLADPYLQTALHRQLSAAE